MFKRTFTCDEKLWKSLYVLLVRTHLEFASTVWNPYLTGDIKALEKVQKRASRIPSSFKDLS
jgi:hypothetical protein